MVSKFALDICIFTVIAGISMVLDVEAVIIPHDLTQAQLTLIGVEYSAAMNRFTRKEAESHWQVVGILHLAIDFSINNISVNAENIILNLLSFLSLAGRI